MKRKQRSLVSLVVGLVLIVPANIFLNYLKLPHWVNFLMMAALGGMLGTELGKWVNKAKD